ncbi:LCP family protein [Alkalihalobacterium alkalinitrilicum]|uniref:LCP family glycopolymer transferase n=1 Tax=Alkalihalobacterium alkalinitrilicum TaxID=427920 RepID=UPI000994F476|nr:LCP family protein [Alkalihalobacterium alkalinitrilicum]
MLKRTDKRKRKNRRRLLWFIIPLLIIVVPTVAYGSYLTYKLASAASEVNQELARGDKSEKRLEPIDPKSDNFSVLFLGIDTLEPNSRGARTDSMMLVTFNKEEQSIKMLSIPRDSRVNIVGRDRLDKINHAHAFGGVDMSIDTVEELLDVPVDYFVRLNFTAFIEVINALGGVEVEVPFTFNAHGSQGSRNAVTIYKGLQRLNGEEALAYARMRKDDPRGDIGRGERQQEVVKGVIKEAASLSSILRFDTIIDEISEHISTNFLFENMLALHPYASSINDIEQLSLRGDNLRLDGIYYYQLDQESVEDVSHELRVHLGLEESLPNSLGMNEEDVTE